MRRRAILLTLCLLSPLPAFAADPPQPFDVRAALRQYDPGFTDHRKAALAKLRPLLADAMAREARGQQWVCAKQIGAEARWLVNNTAEWARVDELTDALADELARPIPTPIANRQIAPDGYWESCHRADWMKLLIAYDRLAEAGGDKTPPAMRPAFLDRYRTRVGLRAEFLRLLVSDPAHDGISRRREMNEVVSDVMRLILRDQPPGYDWSPGLKDDLRQLLEEMRDPDTGYWGGRYVDGGRTVATTDLSITFHIVRYLKGKVPDWPKLIATTLAIKDRAYPFGWQSTEGYFNHHNYDVAELFRLGWQHADADQRTAIAHEMAAMLDWCLTRSLQPDGSFKLSEEDDSVETSYYFGVSFLKAVGYFDPAGPFWKGAPIPGAEDLRQRLIARIEGLLSAGTGAEGGYYYRSALQVLKH